MNTVSIEHDSQKLIAFTIDTPYVEYKYVSTLFDIQALRRHAERLMSERLAPDEFRDYAGFLLLNTLEAAQHDSDLMHDLVAVLVWFALDNEHGEDILKGKFPGFGIELNRYSDGYLLNAVINADSGTFVPPLILPANDNTPETKH